ncbi:MAG: hypothetical protein K8L99_32805 [Anaerolineae bacterium]|jgi:membrane protein implicated in regulation of membrane protease activity|nr:hypothetical protein [Anaerolineae bacterium]MCL4722774.1 hypothetical protein [Rhodocyclaceae bacterium]MCZ2112838.1 hypothetical protein [Anaerolineae bacterium]GIK44744.1 MAG: hypothetical protein BroJett012_06470 [Betaproteobacteria bacterium]
MDFSNESLWSMVGLLLTGIELLTGTFYLLVLGIGAFAAAVAAYFGGGFAVQILVASITAIAGWGAVRWYRQKGPANDGSNDFDIGQMVTVESWVDQAAGIVKVRYRGAQWDALVDCDTQPGSTLYITGRAAGGQLLVSSIKRM